jgi:FkbM family methyltransferase
MKEWLNYALCRYPRIYQNLVQLRRTVNAEKVVFLNLVRDGDVVFDVGANRGYYTILFSHLVGEGGEVHAFEPSPPTFEQLSRYVSKRKRFQNISLNMVAVGDTNGKAKLHTPDNDDGQASLAVHKFGSWRDVRSVETFECGVIKLDDYAITRGLDRLDFIKCDIEGGELMALKGLSKTINRFHPVLHIELCKHWSEDFNYSPIEVIDYLAARGYSEFHLITEKLCSLHNLELQLSEVFSANLLCTIPTLHSARTDRLLKGNYPTLTAA